MTSLGIILPSAVGIVAGVLLLRRAPTLGECVTTEHTAVSVIIPARNEEKNLPQLLFSLRTLPPEWEVIVVDDDSSDATAMISYQNGSRVLSSKPLPEGWRGKTWACWQGSQIAQRETLLLLDADTWFVSGGLRRFSDCFAALPSGTVISVLPFHRMQHWYEQLSLFFNLLMAMGAGGFGRVDAPHMFGQCMMTPRSLYQAIGGHAAVSHAVVENMELAEHITAAGGRISTYVGKGSLEMRMFPEGLAQMHRSWKKSFTDGARSSSPQVLALSYLYLSGFAYVVICLLTSVGVTRAVAGLMYGTFAALLMWQSRQLGTYRVLTALFYPIPLIFYFVVFAETSFLKLCGKKVSWRGRDI